MRAISFPCRKSSMNPFFRNSLLIKIRGAIAEAQAASEMDHKYLRGKLREIAVRGLIEPWLIGKFAVGSGKITDCNGKLSNEIDLLIYANDVIPPVVYSDDGFGLYPCESCIAVIEVKSKLDAGELKGALESSELIASSMELQSGRWNETGTQTISHKFIQTAHCLFAFSSDLSGSNMTELERYLKYAEPGEQRRLDMICVVGTGCWINKSLGDDGNGWVSVPPSDDFDEVIAFCSVLSGSLFRIYRDRGTPPINRYFGFEADG
jgi:hypothetical protein